MLPAVTYFFNVLNYQHNHDEKIYVFDILNQQQLLNKLLNRQSNTQHISIFTIHTNTLSQESLIKTKLIILKITGERNSDSSDVLGDHVAIR